jgi:hypothetical protein
MRARAISGAARRNTGYMKVSVSQKMCPPYPEAERAKGGMLHGVLRCALEKR